MKLHLTEFLRHLNDRPMTLLAEHGIRALPAGNKNRRALASTFRPMLHQAGKFIFDSGSDADGDTTQAVKETVIAMLEDGRFHLPYPTTWIEDPFENDPEQRNFYLAYEKGPVIRVWTALRRHHPASPTFFLCTLPLIIDLSSPVEGHRVPVDLPPGHPGHDPVAFRYVQELLGQADYAFRKFIVALGSGGIERHEVANDRPVPGVERPNVGPQKPRGNYPYTIIRIPDEPVSDGSGLSTGLRRRRHFVRGFVWGKNTRPRDQQRWVAGYYRGAADLGEIERSHYEMRGGAQRNRA
jgi:hypothetical protein